MPIPRVLRWIFAGGAVLAVTVTLFGADGPARQAGIVALLAAAASVALGVRQPVARWSLTAGILLLAAAEVARWRLAPSLPSVSQLNRADLSRYDAQVADQRFTDTVLVLLAVVALTAGVLALPQFRRPAWLTAVACGVALVPVTVLARDVAGDGRRAFIGPRDTAGFFLHVAPGLAATVLAGLAVVLAVSRADRWFLAPAGALLLQVTAAALTSRMSGAWYSQAAFLQPGMMITYGYAPTGVAGLEIEDAVVVAASLLAPALLAAGAARTADVTPSG